MTQEEKRNKFRAEILMAREVEALKKAKHDKEINDKRWIAFNAFRDATNPKELRNKRRWGNPLGKTVTLTHIRKLGAYVYEELELNTSKEFRDTLAAYYKSSGIPPEINVSAKARSLMVLGYVLPYLHDATFPSYFIYILHANAYTTLREKSKDKMKIYEMIETISPKLISGCINEGHRLRTKLTEQNIQLDTVYTKGNYVLHSNIKQ